MDLELENKAQGQSSEQKNEGQENSATNYQKDYRSGTRPQRPRIRVQRAYTTGRSSGDEGGFRPEGFGTGLLQNNNNTGYQPRQQAGYRPRFNNAEGNQTGYQPRQQAGYRPRFNNAEGNQTGYQPRQQAGYRPRFNNAEGNQTGYQPRQQAGYRPRFNNAEGNQTGYQPRQQAGYRPRFNNAEGNQGGFQQRGARPQRGGYNKNYQQGGYRPRTADYDPNAKYSMKKRIEYSESHIDPNEPIRLNKFLANAGVCSRREADEYIEAGAVTVNGAVVTELGTKVKRSDEIKFQDNVVTLEKKVYVLLNKPKDCVTTSDDPQNRKTVMDIVGNVCPERIYPVGRLDRNTTGVLLLTNDGDLASKLTHPKFLKKKVYHVFLDKNVTAHDMQQIAEGIELEDGEIHADAIEYASDTDKSQVGIEIHSGKNRIVRRIFEHLGYRVVKLDRVQFAGLTKKNLRRGDWRFLTEKEVDMLRMGAFE